MVTNGTTGETRIEPLDSPRRRRAVRALSRALVGSALSARVPFDVQRRWMGLLARIARIPESVAATQTELGGVPAERIETPSQDGAGPRPALLYLHGGAYVIEHPPSVRAATITFAVATGAVVYSLDYRLAPEHPLPAAIDDAIAAYDAIEAPRVALAGDSAGGGLALATALRARGEGLRAPAALALQCPWLDLTLSGRSIESNRRVEPVLSRGWLAKSARAYAGSAAIDDPRCSPLFARLAGLPPILVQDGADDLLRSDSKRLADRAREAGVELELELYSEMWHDFQLNAGLLHTADAALASAAEFVRRELATSSS